MFIVLLAALESARPGGTRRPATTAQPMATSATSRSRRSCRSATTIIPIRLIEGFKIIDMPNILLGSGPGTAAQSMTLRAYIDWNTLNLGRSAVVATCCCCS